MTLARAIDDAAFALSPAPLSLDEPASAQFGAAPGALTAGRAAVVLRWIGVGLLTAYVMSRRGHDFRPAAALGVVLGPLLVPLAIAKARHGERQSQPLVVRPGTRSSGPVQVLIGIGGDPESATAALAMLDILGPRLGRITVGRAVPFDCTDPNDGSSATAEAVFAVETSTLFFHRYDPGAVLVPGPWPKALLDYAARRWYDVVFLVVDGRPSSQRGLDNLTQSVPTVFIRDQSRREQ